MLHPFFFIGPGQICGLLLTMTVEVKELDGVQWNHLLLSNRTPAQACGGEDGRTKIVVSGEAHLSMSGAELPVPEGGTITARVWADCDSGWGFKDMGTFEAQYRIWTCDVTKLELQ